MKTKLFTIAAIFTMFLFCIFSCKKPPIEVPIEYGRVSVIDQAGNFLRSEKEGIKVTLIELDSVYYTDTEGNFQLKNLDSGATYTLKFEKEGLYTLPYYQFVFVPGIALPKIILVTEITNYFDTTGIRLYGLKLVYSLRILPIEDKQAFVNAYFSDKPSVEYNNYLYMKRINTIKLSSLLEVLMDTNEFNFLQYDDIYVKLYLAGAIERTYYDEGILYNLPGHTLYTDPETGLEIDPALNFDEPSDVMHLDLSQYK